MNRDIELLINRVAQDIAPMQDALTWFDSQPVDDKRAAIRDVNAMVLQAHPRPDEVAAAVERSELRRGSPSVVLASKGQLSVQLAKIAELPEPELQRSFRLAIWILAIADGRRRSTECRTGCSHWWHRNLTTP